MTPDDAARAASTQRPRPSATRCRDPARRPAGPAPSVPGQYALDLVADAAASAVLEQPPVRIVSEESGVHERAGASITVVIDPVDGSTNCSRGIAYWATSIGALDADGRCAALVVNQAAGVAHDRDPRRRRVPRRRPPARVDASPASRSGDRVRAAARPAAAVEAVPRASAAARSRCATSRPAASTGTSTAASRCAVGLSRRLSRVSRSRRDRARRARRTARHDRSRRAPAGRGRRHAGARRRILKRRRCA